MSTRDPIPLPSYRCAGAACPGLPYKASEHPHPVECLGSAYDATAADRVDGPSTLAPTRADLERLLWSDPASEAWQGDAGKMLMATRPDVGRVCAVLEAVAAELGSTSDGLAGDSQQEDLLELAMAAQRGAILLLHAAWAARKAAER